MKILHINSVCGVTGTGRIVADLYETATAAGHECMIAYGEHKFQNNPGTMQVMEIGTMRDCQVHALVTRLFDGQGLASRKATKAFLRRVRAYDPDVIHLHNLHGYYINIELLFRYLRDSRAKLVWTLHDCWPYTGHCVYYQETGCEKWKSGCHHCPLRTEYPASLLWDGSKRNYRKKKSLFTGLKNMTLVVPSEWLARQVKESFLQEYPVKVVYNGIDLETYRPTPGEWRDKHGLQDKYVVLGVANVWTERKGLKTFLELADRLDDRYKVVLVGLSEAQLAELPEHILGLPRTDTAKELAEIYTASDVLVQPGREETFGLTVAEAAACGTMPVVYEGTACAEVARLGAGMVTDGGVDELEQAIRGYLEQGAQSEEGCPAQQQISKKAAYFSKERFGQDMLAVYED